MITLNHTDSTIIYVLSTTSVIMLIIGIILAVCVILFKKELLTNNITKILSCIFLIFPMVFIGSTQILSNSSPNKNARSFSAQILENNPAIQRIDITDKNAHSLPTTKKIIYCNNSTHNGDTEQMFAYYKNYTHYPVIYDVTVHVKNNTCIYDVKLAKNYNMWIPKQEKIISKDEISPTL